MIYLIHQNNNVINVLNNKFEKVNFNINQSITNVLYQVAKAFPEELIIWCNHSNIKCVNINDLSSIFHHKRILASYSLNKKFYINNQIGYVDQSIYIKVKKDVTYPTWLMSSDIGGIHAELLNTVLKDLNKHAKFDYFLNSLAKNAMQQGLFCYSEPKLLTKEATQIMVKSASTFSMFQFVKEHYKWVWVVYLFICLLIFEKRLALLPFIKSFIFKNRQSDLNFEVVEISSSKQIISKREIDVIIPTIGRKEYLYDVLKDLASQTILPKNVIIVEQNPKENSKSELDYLTKEEWPFNIKHEFIHQSGVCNARNLALSKVVSEWTLLGDDDNRFEADLIEKLFSKLEQTGNKVGTTVYLQPHEEQTYTKTAQTPIFGGGNSILKTNLLANIEFSKLYEYNYGEDIDFGMQLRYLGEDIIFYSDIHITHLKAPMGGYRIQVKQIWDDDGLMPKPSPTIMLLKLMFFTKQQQLAYKLLLLIQYAKNERIVNPFKFLKQFKSQWNRSVYWSNKLIEKENA